MPVADEVLQAAEERAAALAAGDRERLLALLHPDFRWTSHTGAQFDRDGYVHANTGGGLRWSGQQIVGAEVVVHDRAAVLRCLVLDTVEPLDRGDGVEVFRMPMTQVWVRHAGAWVCLAGHAGPRLAAE